MLKPGAGKPICDADPIWLIHFLGIWGIPGYTLKGIYAEISKATGASVQNYIIAARIANGYEDCHNAEPQDRLDVVNHWHEAQAELAAN